jgi:acyl-homoserine lactone acylase PvdQ
MQRSLLTVLLAALSGACAQAADLPDVLLKKSAAVLAQLEGTLTVPGLKEPVEVLRDRWGVPHIYAKNQDDLFFAQGFVVAQDPQHQGQTGGRISVVIPH